MCFPSKYLDFVIQLKDRHQYMIWYFSYVRLLSFCCPKYGFHAPESSRNNKEYRMMRLFGESKLQNEWCFRNLWGSSRFLLSFPFRLRKHSLTYKPELWAVAFKRLSKMQSSVLLSCSWSRNSQTMNRSLELWAFDNTTSNRQLWVLSSLLAWS